MKAAGLTFSGLASFVVTGSGAGNVIALCADGEVLAYPADNDDLNHIAQFDVEEWCDYHDTAYLDSEIDMLDIGFWTKTGEYVEPELDSNPDKALRSNWLKSRAARRS